MSIWTTVNLSSVGLPRLEPKDASRAPKPQTLRRQRVSAWQLRIASFPQQGDDG